MNQSVHFLSFLVKKRAWSHKFTYFLHYSVASFFKSLVFKPNRVEESAIFLSAVINSGEPSFKAVAI